MTKRIAVPVLIILAVAIIPLLASAQSSLPDRPAQLVHVSIQSRPDIAEVRIDGAFVGTTPLAYRLTPGVHRIVLSRDGFESWSRELTVTADNATGLTGLLERVDAKPCH